VHGPARLCQLSVKMLKDAPITYTVPLKKVVEFALHGTAKGLQTFCERSESKICSDSIDL
jgi:hypothetical protein